MAYLGIPLSKVGAVLYPEGEYGFDWPSNEQVAEWVDKIKTRGLAGLSLFSINKVFMKICKIQLRSSSVC